MNSDEMRKNGENQTGKYGIFIACELKNWWEKKSAVSTCFYHRFAPGDIIREIRENACKVNLSVFCETLGRQKIYKNIYIY